jgi:alkanesulfonate monooxygenase SsuD/methylene tetrahydromethanopterin reductase-like flavin-dependent oxidoreductase (luciferase family)
MRIPGSKPCTPSSESQPIHEVLEQIHYAEQQGFSSVWFSEHHFRPGVVAGELSRLAGADPASDQSFPSIGGMISSGGGSCSSGPSAPGLRLGWPLRLAR